MGLKLNGNARTVIPASVPPLACQSARQSHLSGRGDGFGGFFAGRTAKMRIINGALACQPQKQLRLDPCRADGAEIQFPGAVDREVNAAASDFVVFKTGKSCTPARPCERLKYVL